MLASCCKSPFGPESLSGTLEAGMATPRGAGANGVSSWRAGLTDTFSTFPGQGAPRRAGALRLLLCGAGAVAVYGLCIGVSFAIQGKTADFNAFLNGAMAAAQGTDLYATETGYIYPPLLAVLLAPLLWLPAPMAAVSWVVVQWALMMSAAVASADLARKQTALRESRAATILIASAVCLVLGDKLVLELRDGNCDAVIIWCWLGALWAVGRRPAMAGACIGLAVNIKYTTIVLIPYLLVTRRWREAVWALFCTTLLGLLPALWLGWSGNAAAWTRALGGLLGLFLGQARAGPVASMYPVTWELSVSFTSALARLSVSAGLPAGMGMIASSLVALVIGLTAWRVYVRSSVPTPWSLARMVLPNPDLLVAAEWWCLLAGTLAFSPQTPTRHLNMAVPLVALAAALAASLPAGRWRMVQYGSLAGMGAALWLPPSSDWTHGWVHAWRVAGGPCVALLVLAWTTSTLALSKCGRSATVLLGSSTPGASRPTKPWTRARLIPDGSLRLRAAAGGLAGPAPSPAVPHHANPPH